MSSNSFVRRQIRELEARDDYRAIHSLLKGWPWPSDERFSLDAAFDDVTRRISVYELTSMMPSR